MNHITDEVREYADGSKVCSEKWMFHKILLFAIVITVFVHPVFAIGIQAMVWSGLVWKSGWCSLKLSAQQWGIVVCGYVVLLAVAFAILNILPEKMKI